MINPRIEDKGIQVGRDRLFNILRGEQLLVKRKKRRAYTTQSNHRFRTYKNLIKDIKVTRRDQVYISDITYIDTMEGFSYLSFITDLYSRKIVGHRLSRDLTIEGNMASLRMAVKDKNDKELIHHSDRGLQYCSKSYVKYLKEHGCRISMTEEDHVYENAVAERVNGILKEEFMLGDKLASHEVARKMVEEAIEIYNRERLHTSLDYMTPEQKYAN